MLDVTLFRVDQGGNPDLVRESQRRRYADVTLVDKVIEIDSEWRKSTRPVGTRCSSPIPSNSL
jgi:seryl-tRNA synthetase